MNLAETKLIEGILIGTASTIAGLSAIYYGRKALLNWGPIKKWNDERQYKKSLKKTSEAYIEAITNIGEVNEFGYPDEHPGNWTKPDKKGKRKPTDEAKKLVSAH